MKVYKMGTKVRSKMGEIEAYVTGVCMRSCIEYEISYFVGGERKSTWLYDFEIELAPKRKKAGMVNYEQEEEEPQVLIELNGSEISAS